MLVALLQIINHNPQVTMPRKRKSAVTVTDDAGAFKRAKLLDDDDSGEEAENQGLQINEDYAKRFKHNKERAELHRLEEKYGKDGDKETDESSSEGGTEDEDGDLVDENLDDEIAATLAAIKSKDPRIYAKDSKFYTEAELAEKAEADEEAKPMYLRDYHRKILLENEGSVDQEVPMTYAQEQDQLKRTLLEDINAATDGDTRLPEGSDDEFLVRKQKIVHSKRVERPPAPDPRTAEEDPSTFLSNFFAARAWVPTERSQFHPLESDDEEQESEAEKLEHAWNLRFEDPANSNKMLTTHSREIVAKYSVRREELNGRKKEREKEKDKKVKKKLEREEERKRYKNLKVRDMEQKFEKIRDAAGLRGKKVDVNEWADLLEGDWDDEEWNTEMSRRFGDDYYGDADEVFEGGESTATKSRKPKWEDDIDVKDIVPDFDEEVEDETDEGAATELEDGDEMQIKSKSSSSKTQRAKNKAASRRERRIIESLAEASMPLSLDESSSGNFQPFRYRETSPNTFGLTPLDILAADDTQLNQFAGLKKLASFRDPEWKKNDKKKLSKKARLRLWRKDTFGNEDGPDINTIVAPAALNPAKEGHQEFSKVETNIGDVDTKLSKKKKKRKSRKSKAS